MRQRAWPPHLYGSYARGEQSDDSDIDLRFLCGGKIDFGQLSDIKRKLESTGESEDALYMFRDSFGNALVPFLAASFERATFSKLVPYNVPAAMQAGAQAVVIERAERHIADLATAPPIVPSPVLKFSGDAPSGARAIAASVDVVADGPYWVVSGVAREELRSDDSLYVRAQTDSGDVVFYDPLWLSFVDESGAVTADNGFKVYIPTSSLDAERISFTLYTR